MIKNCAGCGWVADTINKVIVVKASKRFNDLNKHWILPDFAHLNVLQSANLNITIITANS